ncbi:MAG TPA: DUF6788 family protein [Ktedonobacteraceae bacterium]|nr:DUF6788 family protein [Ktedonobacteraceae bacterium]
MSRPLPTDRTITYQLQYRTCGKPYCRCRHDTSKRHGKYVYAYWRGEDGKLKSKYIGKAMPESEDKMESG